MKKKRNNTAKDCTEIKNAKDLLSVFYLPTTDAAVADGSWLESVLNPDEVTLRCQHRNFYSEIFLQTMLYPLVNQQEVIDEKNLINLMVEFKKMLSGTGCDFEISNVIGSILRHFQCYSIIESDTSIDQPSILDKDLLLFDALID